MGASDNMTVGVRLSSKDDTGPGVRSAIANLFRLRTLAKPITVPVNVARSGLSLLRDLQMGLRPTLQMIDHVVDQGSSIEAVQKVFETRTGRTGARADFAAKALQAAAFGTLSWVDAMRQANKGLSDDIGLDEQRTIFRFAAMKAAAEREKTGTVLEGLMSGLGVGRASILKQFGIDLAGVEERYARLKNVEAFDDLDFGERKAVIMKAALEKMTGEINKFKLTGRESGFVWQSMKTMVGDWADKMMLAVSRSQAMKDTMMSVRDVMAGITHYFEKGGGLGKLIFGGGKSGGLFGILKGGLVDAGEALVRGLLGGLLKGVGSLGNLITAGWTLLASKIGGLWEGFKQKAGEALDRFPALAKEGFAEFIDTMRYMPQALNDVFGPFIDQFKAVFLEGIGWLREIWGEIREWLGLRIPLLAKDHPDVGATTTQPAGDDDRYIDDTWYNRLLRPGVQGLLWLLGGDPDNVKDFRPSAKAGGLGLPSNPALAAAIAANYAAIGGTKAKGGFFDSLSRKGDVMLNSGIFAGRSRARDAANAFIKEYGGYGADNDMLRRFGIEPSDYALSGRARRALNRRMADEQKQLRRIEHGDYGIRQAAMLQAQAAAQKLAGQGKQLNRYERRRLFEDIYRQMRDERKGAVNSRLGADEETATRDDLAREVRRRISRRRSVGAEVDAGIEKQIRQDVAGEYEKTGKTRGESWKASPEERKAAEETAKNTREMLSRIDAVVTAVGGLATAFAGAESQVAAVRRKGP